jgi:hypothetical protein
MLTKCHSGQTTKFAPHRQRPLSLLPLKLRRPFFDKGGYALASIISRDNPSKFGLLDGQPVVDRGVETAMNRGQRRTDRERRFGRKHFRQGQRFRKQTRSRRDSVDQSEAGCFFRLKNRPVRMSSMAALRPMFRGRRCVPPKVGIIPMLISDLLKVAIFAATARWVDSTNSQPPP